MGLIICVSKTEALNHSKLRDLVSDTWEDVVSSDGQWRFTPQAGKLMAVLDILNEEGIAYHFQSSKHHEEW